MSVALKDGRQSFSNYNWKIRQEQFPSVEKFRIMNFLMGKGYWEFVTGDEIKPPLLENPTQQQIQANKTWHEKAKKVFILAFCECVRLHDYAYSRCKITQASLGYIGENV